MKNLLTLLFTGSLWLSVAYSQQDKVNSYFGINIATSTVEAYIQTRMDELNIPGLSLAIINGGEVVYQEVFGYADVEKNIPVTTATIF